MTPAEVVTAPVGYGWESRIVGGPLGGIVWSANNERESIEHHVALSVVLRLWEQSDAIAVAQLRREIERT